jgi:hypothetical protein
MYDAKLENIWAKRMGAKHKLLYEIHSKSLYFNLAVSPCYIVFIMNWTKTLAKLKQSYQAKNKYLHNYSLQPKKNSYVWNWKLKLEFLKKIWKTIFCHKFSENIHKLTTFSPSSRFSQFHDVWRSKVKETIKKYLIFSIYLSLESCFD